jgi:hypothetical protein
MVDSENGFCLMSVFNVIFSAFSTGCFSGFYRRVLLPTIVGRIADNYQQYCR